jgi:hypothetical protein
LSDGKLAGGEFKLWERVEELIRKTSPEAVIFEDFLIYPGKAKHLYYDRLPAVQVIGVVKSTCERLGVPWIAQTAAQGKGANIKRIRGFSRHASDATRHAVTYAFRSGLRKTYSWLLAEEQTSNAHPRNDGLEKGIPAARHLPIRGEDD